MSRNDQDPSAQVAAELRARLRAMGSDELIELCAQLLGTYVVEGVVPLSRAGESGELLVDTGEESFAQMLKRLKASKRDPVLEQFFIDGENISVRIDGQGIMPITTYRSPNRPPAAPGVSVQMTQMPRREGAPGAATSIYNRSLYAEEQQQAARTAQPPPPPLAPPPQRTSAPAQQAQPPAPQRPAQQPQQPAKKPGEEKPQSDRFSLIELE